MLSFEGKVVLDRRPFVQSGNQVLLQLEVLVLFQLRNSEVKSDDLSRGLARGDLDEVMHEEPALNNPKHSITGRVFGLGIHKLLSHFEGRVDLIKVRLVPIFHLAQ
mmetsp:Transcript_23146/g.22621  ORF Transcript_23146/g.22621 Transcript_23146/m.22621 type:complete len:106 (-) Transcript_23146:1762-2079(-)